MSAELRQKLSAKLADKERREGRKSITEGDRRRWRLPHAAWQEFDVPFDSDSDWPKPLRDALSSYRAAWRAKMDEVNRAITENANMEEIVDRPDVVGGIVRVSGPFTVEGVRPEESRSARMDSLIRRQTSLNWMKPPSMRGRTTEGHTCRKWSSICGPTA